MSAPFPLIDLRHLGDARQRGRAIGQATRERIARSLSTYAHLFALAGVSWAQACERARRYRDVIGALDASLVEEIEGLAEGCGQAREALLALNCRSEILPPNYFSGQTLASAGALAANRAAGVAGWAGANGLPEDLSECTAISVAARASANGHAWMAQNWDWIGRQRGALVILRLPGAQGGDVRTLTEAGMLAKIGLNDAGFALGLNILRSPRDGAQPGVPVHVLLRHLLDRCASLADLRERLARLAASLGFAAASNVPCADAAGHAASFEVAPAGWAELAPVAEGVALHTNHFLCESLLAEQSPMANVLSSGPRLATARGHQGRGPWDRERLAALLRDESDGYLSICRAGDPALPPEARVESVAGVIIDATARRWWIAPDLPSRAEFAPVD